MYDEKMRLCYVDTDSLALFIDTDNLYSDMKLNHEKFDTSNFDEDNTYDIRRQNKAVPDVVKDEKGGKVIWEFVGLRSKLPCNNDEGKSTRKAKGIKRNVVGQLDAQNYRNSLYDVKVLLRKQTIFRSILQTNFTQTVKKVALSPYATKRYIIPELTPIAVPGIQQRENCEHAIIQTATLIAVAPLFLSQIQQQENHEHITLPTATY